MCGIAGEINFSQQIKSRDHLHNTLEALSPRGPDSFGWQQGDQFLFGHRRLSIIDLSSKGHQPMSDPSETLTITYNGEIYNYQELRKELIELGHKFKSHSDTEVLLKAYSQWGHKMISKLNGMFAFVIFDKNRKQAFMARDRLGIKPLYYTEHGKSLYFSSSLTSLLKIPRIPKKINAVALNHYFTFHSIVPAPHTLIESIKKFPAGCYGVLSPGKNLQIYNYWNLDFEKKENLSEEN